MRMATDSSSNLVSALDLASPIDIDLNSPLESTVPPTPEPASTVDKSDIAHLVAEYGSSSATAWLEFERYKIWCPTEPIPESTFVPVQGYMRRDPYIFAWGNPLVSDPAALLPTALAFRRWVESQGLRPIWSCVDQELQHVLAEPPFKWSVVHCIYEDVVDPAHIVELTAPEMVGKKHGASVVKDLKKNLKRAEKAAVHVTEVRDGQMSEEDKRAIDLGILHWKKSRSGVQLASTTMQPWLDSSHRRYWVARKDNKVVGFLILTPIQRCSWQIKNAVSFPEAPRGTSESLIYTALVDLYNERCDPDRCPSPERGHSRNSSTGSTMSNGSGRGNGHPHRVTVTFGISASDDMEAVENLSGWKVTLLSSIYNKVALAAGLLKRGEFRRKFDSEHEPMYVCYPQDGFGLDGVNALLKLLRK